VPLIYKYNKYIAGCLRGRLPLILDRVRLPLVLASVAASVGLSSRAGVVGLVMAVGEKSVTWKRERAERSRSKAVGGQSQREATICKRD
jgi:hypothetical protein